MYLILLLKDKKNKINILIVNINEGNKKEEKLDVFSYYPGEIGIDIVIHEVYLSGEIVDKDLFATMIFNKYDSKVCASKIEIGPRISIENINNIINHE